MTIHRWVGAVARPLSWVVVVAAPIVVLALFRSGQIDDPRLGGPTAQFFVVSLTSVVVLAVAVLMRVAAGHLNDPRALFLSLAFITVSGIFLVDALTTPGVLVPAVDSWIGLSSSLGLLGGSTFLFASTVRWSPRNRAIIVRRKRLITGILVASIATFGALAIGSSIYPSELSVSWNRLSVDVLAHMLAALTVLMLGIVIFRYTLIYRISPTPLVTGILVSSIHLVQSKLSMTTSLVWHASWWQYHVLILVGFCVALGGLLLEYSGAKSLRGAVGGLLLQDSLAKVKSGYTDVIIALIEAVEAKDPYTRGHTQQVSELSLLIAQQLGLSHEDQSALNQAAVLHDIGKIGIPDAVLNKPGKLTEEEFSLIKEHPDRGYRIIQHIRSLDRQSDGVRYHHERLDGSGYPDGLRGDEIPLFARIIAVADVFDALTAARPYREAYPVDKAIAIIKSERGSRLDPECVDALLEVIPVWSGRMKTELKAVET